MEGRMSACPSSNTTATTATLENDNEPSRQQEQEENEQTMDCVPQEDDGATTTWITPPPTQQAMDPTYWFFHFYHYDHTYRLGFPPRLRNKDIMLGSQHLIPIGHKGTEQFNAVVLARLPFFINYPKRYKTIIACIVQEIQGKLFVASEGNDDEEWVEVPPEGQARAVKILQILQNLAAIFRFHKEQSDSLDRDNSNREVMTQGGEESYTKDSFKVNGLSRPDAPPAVAWGKEQQHHHNDDTNHCHHHHHEESHVPGDHNCWGNWWDANVWRQRRGKNELMSPSSPHVHSLGRLTRWEKDISTEYSSNEDSLNKSSIVTDEDEGKRSTTVSVCESKEEDNWTEASPDRKTSDDDISVSSLSSDINSKDVLMVPIDTNINHDGTLEFRKILKEFLPDFIQGAEGYPFAFGLTYDVELSGSLFFECTTNEDSSKNWEPAEDKVSLALKITQQLEDMEIQEYDLQRKDNSQSLQSPVVQRDDFRDSRFDVRLGQNGKASLGDACFARMIKDRMPAYRAHGNSVLPDLVDQIVRHINSLGGRFFCRVSDGNETEWRLQEQSNTLFAELSRCFNCLLGPEANKRIKATSIDELKQGYRPFDAKACVASPTKEKQTKKKCTGNVQDMPQKTYSSEAVPTKKRRLGNSKTEGGPKKKRKRIRERKKYEPELRVYVEKTDKDVLCARGGNANKHHGNLRYHDAKTLLQPEYEKRAKDDKSEISQKLVDAVHAWGGRFLELDRHNNRWYVVHDKKARIKASQALRENYTPEERGLKRARYRMKQKGLKFAEKES